MSDVVNLPLILIAALVATASPGPSTLAVAGT
jgi:threonine/homoserine/homoserine lactone efflux protein